MKNTSHNSLRLAAPILTNLCRLLSTLAVLMLLASPTARADSAPVKNVLVLGDSIGSAYGMPVKDGWVALLQEKADDDGFSFAIVNASVTGDTTGNGLSRLPALLTEYQPVMVIIELGGNDGLRGLSIKKLKSNLIEMASMARDSGAEVLIVAVQLPGNYGKAYNKLFAKAFASAAEKTESALLTSLFEGMDASDKWFQSDGIHPNETAQPVMLNNIWQVAKPLFEQIHIR